MRPKVYNCTSTVDCNAHAVIRTYFTVIKTNQACTMVQNINTDKNNVIKALRSK